jgi:hypothetical protein
MSEAEHDPSTSGQVGPKSQSGKLREKSNVPLHSERLQQGDGPPVGGADRQARRMEKSAYRAERTGAKLEAAKGKRDQKKPPKNPASRVPGGVIKSMRRAAGHELYRYAHGKIHQAEQENVGVEAAHRAELIGERATGTTKRFIGRRIRTRPARRVRKWEKRDVRAKADLQFRKLTREHPEIKKNALSRLFQKRRLKKQYQKQARAAAKKGAKAAKKTAVSAVRFVASNPKVLIVVGIAFLLVAALQSCVGMFAALSGGGTGAIGGAAESADAIYTRFETDLRMEINNMETAYPGYDEYRRNLGPVGHNPAELLGFLLVCDSFPEAEMESVLREVFDAQYMLATAEITETRETDNGDGTTSAEEIRVLEITLTVAPFAEAVAVRLTPAQLERFNQYDYTQ